MSRISDPSRKVKYTAVFPFDCVAVGGRCAHFLRVYGNGNLTVTDGDGNQETFAVYDREPVVGNFASVDAFTGTGIRAHWPQTS